MLGEANTEQFEIITRLDGCEIHRRKIHDPFIRTTTVIKGIGAATHVNGTHWAMQSVMMLKPPQKERTGEK